MKKETTINETSPKTGEYWYADSSQYITIYDIIIIKVIDVIENGTKILGVRFGSYMVLPIESLKSKWKPSRFWRMLGYK